MIITSINPFIAIFLLALPTLVHRSIAYNNWKNRDMDHQAARTILQFELHRKKDAIGFPVKKYWRYWVAQIAVFLILFFPFQSP